MEKTVTRKAQAKLPTTFGEFQMVVYEDHEKKEHAAFIKGEINKESPTLVRVHSECLTGDAISSLKCDCGQQLNAALECISQKGGVLLYLRQEGRGIGLANKIKAYALQAQGMDTVQANEQLGFKPDERDYTVGAKILEDLGVGKIKLLTNNPRKIEGLEKYGLEISDRVPLVMKGNKVNKSYLSTKKEKLGHMLEEKGVCK